MRARRRGGALAVAVLMAMAAVQPAAAAGFSVSGKRGPFIKQVSSRGFGNSGAGGSAMGLASDALNQGQYQAARLRMPMTEAKIKTLLDSVEANWPYDKTQPLKVYILGVDHYNAYALPDGSIVVGFGLLERAGSDDEVAFVLGHELGHVRLGHFAQNVDQQRRKASSNGLGQMFLVGSAIQGGAAAMRSGGSVSSALDSGALAASRRAGATQDLLRFINDVMVAPSMSREQEDEADALGFDLSQMRPYAAESASARVFDTVQADEDNRKAMSAVLEGQVKAELGKAIGVNAVSTLMSGGPSRQGLTRGLLKGAGRVALGVAANSEGGPKHRTPEERKRGIAEYSAAAYPDGLPLRDEDKSWLASVRSSREYGDAKLTVEAVRAAMKARADGDYAQAETQLARVNVTPFRSAPMVINEGARLRDDMGDAAGADRLFMQAHQSPDQTVDGYIDHVRMLYRTRQTDRAYQVIDDGTRRFSNDDKPFLSLLVAISRQAGQDQQSEQYLQRCLSYGDEGLSKDCNLAAGRDAKPSSPSAPRLPAGLPRGMPFGVPRIGF